ncbi:hypothetical protein CRG98_014685 [Punica granatum]|uniref:Response regulatory domain-containing protein n=1 Tax=Punica granatum TaxID=22663 RepID=A0A2I0K8M9_PUNGR|nr:hypothetical protein CRG98_014685 [Punica granatum]
MNLGGSFDGSSSSSCSSRLNSKSEHGGDSRPHILAVDDNLLDRKLIEKLLLNSSCKGDGLSHLILSVVTPSRNNRAYIPFDFPELERLVPNYCA